MKRFEVLKNKKGFTLIELIVVIAIIGVIAAIAVPTVMNTLKDQKVKSDIQSATSIARAIRTAYVDRNSDSDTANDLLNTQNNGDFVNINTQVIGDSSTGTGTSDLSTYFDVNKKTSSSNQSFEMSIKDANTPNPVIQVRFKDSDSNTYTVTPEGNVSKS